MPLYLPPASGGTGSTSTSTTPVGGSLVGLRQLGTTNLTNVTYNRGYHAGQVVNVTSYPAQDLSAAYMYALPYFNPLRSRLTQLTIHTGATGTTGSLALYDNVPGAVYPGNRIAYSGNISFPANTQGVGMKGMTLDLADNQLVWAVLRLSAVGTIRMLPGTACAPIYGTWAPAAGTPIGFLTGGDMPLTFPDNPSELTGNVPAIWLETVAP